MIALFIISALVPLGLCAAILYSNFSKGLQVAQQQQLDNLARGYGMVLLGRLQSADEALRPILSDPDLTDLLAESRARKLPWATSVDTSPTPPLDTRQSQALERGETTLLANVDEQGSPAISLLRRLPSGTVLRIGIDPRWVWEDAGDFAGEAMLSVHDAHGRTLTSTGKIPTPVPRDWAVRSWQLFLGAGFAAPSWTVVVAEKRPAMFGNGGETYLPLFAFIALTILLIAWLSMTSIRRQLRPLELLIAATRRLSQRDFGAFRDLHWNDEFGDLATSFGTMSATLQRHFAALETFSHVDRLLLDNPNLESILEKILPQVAAILSCEHVGVRLFNSGTTGSASLYEYPKSGAERTAAPGRVETHPLRHGGECTGVLHLTYADISPLDEDHGVEAQDFADRLSLIIGSLRHSEQLHRQAEFDSLTGLQNRQKLAARVHEVVTAAEQCRGIGSLLYIDLDHFKRVNDTSGHAAGDRLLQIVGERLRNSVEEDASVARLGGDEFAVLLPSVQSPAVAHQGAEKIITLLEQPILVDNRLHQISASIGITLFPADGATLEELMRVGDIAMYHAKERGRGKAEFYRPEMQQALLDRLRLEEGLKHAFEHGQLALHYQPIVSQDASATFAVEALLRWPLDRGMAWVPPSSFIPLAEENGLIVEIGHWVLGSACEQFARWKASGVGVSYASVNVSVRQLKEPDYLENLLHTLREHGMRGEELQIEITESVLAQEMELKGILGRIAAQGVRLALDDFGTGYSSLGYLRTFPIDTVKIDRAFIVGVPQDREASRLVESIILMCEALGKKVVAEGIETDEQRRYLVKAGCTTLQGYFFARPMEATDIPAFAKRLSRNSSETSPHLDAAGTG